MSTLELADGILGGKKFQAFSYFSDLTFSRKGSRVKDFRRIFVFFRTSFWRKLGARIVAKKIRRMCGENFCAARDIYLSSLTTTLKGIFLFF